MLTCFILTTALSGFFLPGLLLSVAHANLKLYMSSFSCFAVINNRLLTVNVEVCHEIWKLI